MANGKSNSTPARSRTTRSASQAEKDVAGVKSTREAAAKATAESVEANSGLSMPSGGELQKAQEEGALEAAKESGKDAYQALTDGALPGAPPARQYIGMDDIMQWEPILDLGLDAFEARLAEDSDAPVPEEKAAGLLSLERAGRNRTDYVAALCKRLGVTSPYEVTNAGPGYTNDITALSQVAPAPASEA